MANKEGKRKKREREEEEEKNGGSVPRMIIL
jgi:hypothetical protein